jgi:phage-related tail protein
MAYNDSQEPIDPEYKKALNAVAEKLVELGLATRTIRRDEAGMLHIQFTQEGKVLQNQMSRIFAAVSQGERLDINELQAFVVVMSMKQFDDCE